MEFIAVSRLPKDLDWSNAVVSIEVMVKVLLLSIDESVAPKHILNTSI